MLFVLLHLARWASTRYVDCDWLLEAKSSARRSEFYVCFMPAGVEDPGVDTQMGFVVMGLTLPNSAPVEACSFFITSSAVLRSPHSRLTSLFAEFRSSRNRRMVF